ncbi:hydantoinase/oxoprolinase family protein [Thalassobaculum salexigens]|uniref:hydantoinase/oxoprolinase family protein n=1 Tax=Thalassobaculum salexigens TaxID=455360 RepID=UPI0004909BE7|nr:hydantoinase/oxoprolinase family protein [Thalassobaculum salexigens]
MVSLKAPWRVGVDVGGTFTDMVIADADGRLHVFKVPSVPEDPARGVMNAVGKAAQDLGVDQRIFLENCAFFAHGSTVATNTLLERKGAKVGLVTTEGFRDSLEIRRGIRANPWDHRTPYPEVLVPRYLRRPVAGRLDTHGRELAPVDLDQAREIGARFRAEGVEAVAICLLNAFANPEHERLVADAVAGSWGGDWIALSSAIVPIIGEYERTSTTVVNAYVAPRVVGYLQALERELIDGGLPHRLFMLQSNGGAVSVRQIAERPVNLILSGPAAGVGSMRHFARAAGHDNLISMEIGGTSCDVMLMAEGRIAITDELSVADYDLMIPSVDIHTVGAGGGTIAGVDAAGMLFAGPRGAGARPGPACYGFGGTEPTVTDANLVLGRLKPGAYAGGSVTLDRELAAEAVRSRVADPLGLSETEAAAGILRLVEQNLLQAVERISIQRGQNPARFMLVACGGAGPMHGAAVARRLGCRAVYVPRQAGAFCALGMLHSDVRQDFMDVHFQDLDTLADAPVEDRFAALERDASEMLTREGFDPADTATEREVDLRYDGQQWDLRIPIAAGAGAGDIRGAFEREYDRRFGHTVPGGRILITALRVVGKGLMPPLDEAAMPAATDDVRAIDHREAYVDDRHGAMRCAVYHGADLRPGHTLQGPLLIEEATTTIFAGPRDRVEVDPAGNYLIHLDREGDA